LASNLLWPLVMTDVALVLVTIVMFAGARAFARLCDHL